MIVVVTLPALLWVSAAVAQASGDAWLDSLRDAVGTTVGDLEPRFGDFVEERESSQDGDVAGPGETGVPREPESVDPDDPSVAALIDRWIQVAEPPENATSGADLRYDRWGRKVGSGGSGEAIRATGKPDYAAGSSQATAWTLRKELDSVDHCTLEEYVTANLADQSIAHCRGRYKTRLVALPDVMGLKAGEAQRRLAAAGLEVHAEIGAAATSEAQSHTVASQRPAAGAKLEPGSRVELTLRGRYDPAIAVPDVVGLQAADAQRRLQAAGFEVSAKIGAAATSEAQSHTVASQRPAAGEKRKPGAGVELTLRGEYVPSSGEETSGVASTAEDGQSPDATPDGVRYVLVGTRANPSGDRASGRSEDSRYRKRWEYTASGNSVRLFSELRRADGELLKKRSFTYRLEGVPREIVAGKPFALTLHGEVSFPLEKRDAAVATARVWSDGLSCIEGCRLAGDGLMRLRYYHRNKAPKKTIRYERRKTDPPKSVRIHLAIKKESEAHIVWIYERKIGRVAGSPPQPEQPEQPEQPDQTRQPYLIGQWAFTREACRGQREMPEDLSLEEAIAMAPFVAQYDFRNDGTFAVIVAPTGEQLQKGRWRFDNEVLTLIQGDGERNTAQVRKRYEDRLVFKNTPDALSSLYRCQ